MVLLFREVSVAPEENNDQPLPSAVTVPKVRTQFLVSVEPHELKKMLLSPLWHRPYAEALLESDPAKLPAVIAAAERAILARHKELSVSPSAPDESLDLRNAANALSQLKQSNKIL